MNEFADEFGDDYGDLFAPEREPVAERSRDPWPVLLVDDEPDIHSALRLALQDVDVEGRPLRLIDAGSASEAKARIAETPGIALVLLDVVMESESAGLELVHHIRRELGNSTIQIVLVTGQPGYAPQREVVRDYEINGYRLKSELTSDKIYASVYAALRTFRVHQELEAQRRHSDEQAATLLAQQARLERWEHVFRHAGWGVAVVSADGARFEFANPAFARMHGYQIDEIAQLPTADLVAPLAQTRLATIMREAVEKGHATAETLHRRKDGAMFPVLVDVTAVSDDAGAPSYRVVNVQDITDRKRIERELDQYRHHLEELVAERSRELAESLERLQRAREAADAANAAKTVFLANMSHEIRTPLSAITGMVHLLRRSGVTPEQAARLDKIGAAGRHLLEIINTILDLAKIEAGKFVLDEADVDLAEITAAVAAMQSDSAQAKGLQLVCAPDAMPRRLVGDAMRLRQALLNLVGNAIKFTERGSVTLRASIVAEDADGVTARFAVEDTGVGVPPEMLPRLFAAFEQGDSSVTRNHGGTGLGLVITRRIAELMGGEAGVSSTLGDGSTFWFTARLKRRPPATPDGGDPLPDHEGGGVEAELRARFGGKRVLIAEDDPTNREVAVELLAEVGLRGECAEDGAVAVERAASATYDVILMDIQMPRVGGLEATQKIRALPGYAQVPIIAMTASAFPEDRARCIDAGMTDFVAKPVDPALLFDAILKSLTKDGAAT